MNKTKSFKCNINKDLDDEQWKSEMASSEVMDRLDAIIAFAERQQELHLKKHKIPSDKFMKRKGKHLQICQKKQCKDELKTWKADSYYKPYL